MSRSRRGIVTSIVRAGAVGFVFGGAVQYLAGVPWHAEPVDPIVAGVEIALGMLAVAHVVRARGAAARRLLPTVR